MLIMKKKKEIFISILLTLCLLLSPQLRAQKRKPIDSKATRETKALFKSLRKLSKKHTLFGHQHAIEYKLCWSGDADRSVVKSVCGSHPAVIGVDLTGFSVRPPEVIERNIENLRKTVVDTYEGGG